MTLVDMSNKALTSDKPSHFFFGDSELLLWNLFVGQKYTKNDEYNAYFT